MQFKYETERLIIKLLNEDHSANVLSFLLNNKEYFEPYEPIPTEKYYTEDYQRMVLQWELKNFLKLRHIRLYAFLKEDPEKIIGTVSFSNILSLPYKSCTTGYKFDKEFQGKGFAFEAFNKCTEAIFRDLELHRIEAYIMPSNFQSINFIEKHGFTHIGTINNMIEVNGSWQDHHLYSLLNPYE